MFLRVGLLTVLLTLPASAQTRHAIEATPTQRVQAVMTYRIESNRFSADHWQAYLPKPPELPGQIKVVASASPAAKLAFEKSPLARGVFLIDQRANTPGLAHKLEMELKVEATLLSRKLVPLAPGRPSPKAPLLKETERKYYVSPSSWIDFDAAAFREWLEKNKLKRAPEETEIAFAERVLTVIRSQFEYGFDPNQDSRASLVCTRARADCGGMAFVFVGALRANGIPARPLVGRLAKPRKDGSRPSDLEYDNPHVRTEFYAQNIGWVPVDPNSVQSDRRRPVSEFLGNDDGDLLVLHVDIDLMLPFRDKVVRGRLLQVSPYYQAYGKGPFDAAFGPSDWSLKVLPLNP